MEHETAGHGAEHSSSGFPPFDQLGEFGVSQVFWLALTFAALYFALSRHLLPRIRKAIADREAVIAANVAEAAALSQKADTAVKAFEQGIAEARARARATADKARAAADQKIAAETARIEADLAGKLATAEAEVAKVRASAMANVSAVAEDAAAAIVERLAGVKPDAAAIKRAVAAARGA